MDQLIIFIIFRLHFCSFLFSLPDHSLSLLISGKISEILPMCSSTPSTSPLFWHFCGVVRHLVSLCCCVLEWRYELNLSINQSISASISQSMHQSCSQSVNLAIRSFLHLRSVWSLFHWQFDVTLGLSGVEGLALLGSGATET